jgi:CMP-N,N'-diacetyllegionaminic acid synthase
VKRVVAIVPARAGSKRVPRKNLRLIGGVSLVARALGTARAARHVTTVVASSDDPEVLAIAAATPGVLPLRRPDELATDTALAIDYVRHVLASLAERGEAPFDAVVIVQPSSPFTTPEDVDAALELLFATGADSAVTVVELDHAIQPAKLKRMEGDRLIAHLEDEQGRTAAHEMPRLFVRNGSVYAARMATIDAGTILGEDSRGVVMPRERSIDINDELDFAFAEFLMSRR